MWKIIKYFTEPFENYDGKWKGISYYEKIRHRRDMILFWAWFILIFIPIITILSIIIKN